MHFDDLSTAREQEIWIAALKAVIERIDSSAEQIADIKGRGEWYRGIWECGNKVKMMLASAKRST